jgi:peptidoglycan/LPS O-acetylase OafA/YrhL
MSGFSVLGFRSLPVGHHRGAVAPARAVGRVAVKSASAIRPEIQALRAAAVSLVLVYHYWPTALRGGYVGVDVFFAISGFLITGQLVREVDRTGRLSMTAFWARRARRILPAALVVLLFCALATVLFMPEIYWRQFFGEMRASTEYAQNWHLAAAAVRYGAADSVPTSLQHYWSLSTEEQFYLVWPILILLAVGVAGLRRVRTGRTSMALVMLALIGGSLAYGIYRTAADPAAAYFVTPTRAWEFALGGLVALLPSFDKASPALRSAASWAGLGAIAVAAITFSSATPFPGYAALLPVGGAILFMLAGAPAHRIAPTPLVRLRPVQFLGDISYSVYLWHWPLLVLAPFAIRGGLHTDTKLVIVAITVVAAWLTKLGIEDPVRAGRFLTRRRPRSTLVLAACATGLVLAVGLGGSSYVKAQIHKDEARTDRLLASQPKCFGAAARDPQHPCTNPALRAMVVPTPVEAASRPNSPCTFVQKSPFNVCAFGVSPAKSVATVALVGDSHASHWRAALEVVAQARHWRGLSITRSGCPFSQTKKQLRGPLIAPCVRWNQQLPHWFAEHPEISTVFVSQESGQKWLVPPGQNQFTAEVAGFTRAWSTLPASVKHVVVIRDTPKNLPSTAGCVERAIAKRKPAGLVCAVPRGGALGRDAESVASTRLHSSRVRTVDLTQFFCDSRRCFPVIGGALVHKDDHHLTAVFATTLGPYLERALEPLNLA